MLGCITTGRAAGGRAAAAVVALRGRCDSCVDVHVASASRGTLRFLHLLAAAKYALDVTG